MAENPNNGGNAPSSPSEQELYRKLYEEVNGPTAGRPLDQQQYQNALIGGRPPPALYQPPGGSMLTSRLLDPRVRDSSMDYTPGNQFRANASNSTGVELGMNGQQILIPPSTGFNPNLPYGGYVFGQASNQGQSAPENFNLMEAGGQYANPFGNQLTQTAPLPLIGFPQTANIPFMNGSLSGPLDTSTYPPANFPSPAAHEVLQYGEVEEFYRQLVWYVDDGPQRIGESIDDYNMRIARCITNMNLIVRGRPPPPHNANLATQNQYERALRNDEETHRERLAQGFPTFDADYVARWQVDRQAQRAGNAIRRARAVDRLRREYLAVGMGPFSDPPNVGTGAGDGNDNDLYTHDHVGNPLRPATEASRREKGYGDRVEGDIKGYSVDRCGPCAKRHRKCSWNKTGLPCDRCKAREIEKLCTPYKLLRRGFQTGSTGQYKKSDQQKAKEAKRKRNQKGKRNNQEEEEEEEEEPEEVANPAKRRRTRATPRPRANNARRGRRNAAPSRRNIGSGMVSNQRQPPAPAASSAEGNLDTGNDVWNAPHDYQFPALDQSLSPGQLQAIGQYASTGQFQAPGQDEDNEMTDVFDIPEAPTLADRVDHQNSFVPNGTAEETLQGEWQQWAGGAQEPSNAEVQDYYQQFNERMDAGDLSGSLNEQLVPDSQNGGVFDTDGN